VAARQALATAVVSQDISLATVLPAAKEVGVEAAAAKEVVVAAVSAISAVKSDILHATACGQLVVMEADTTKVDTIKVVVVGVVLSASPVVDSAI
jgi:hypothetical protein